MKLKYQAQSTGAATNSDASSGAVNWTNPGNVTSSDNTYANAQMALGGKSEYLQCLDFGFDLKRKALIVGLECHVEAHLDSGSTANGAFAEVSLVKGGGIVASSDQSDTNVIGGNADSIFRFGGKHDRWGTSISLADLESPSFGVVIQAAGPPGAALADVMIDHVQLVAFYAHSIKQAMHAHITGSSLITDITGGRVYYRTAPQNVTEPYLTYQVIDATTEHHQGGSSGMGRTRLQVDSYSTDADEVESLATAVRMAVDGFRGTSNETFINNATLENKIDGIEGPSSGKQFGIERTTQDFMVAHDESVPTT